MTTKELLKMIALSAKFVAILFIAAWIAGPMPSTGTGAAVIHGLVDAARLAPLLIVAVVLVGPRWPNVARAFGRVPLTRAGAAAVWFCVALFVQLASLLARDGQLAPMIAIFAFAIYMGVLGLAMLRSEIPNDRQSAAPSQTA